LVSRRGLEQALGLRVTALARGTVGFDPDLVPMLGLSWATFAR